MRTFFKCLIASCFICGCTVTMPTELTVLVCVVDGDTLFIGPDSLQTLQEIECADIDSIIAG